MGEIKNSAVLDKLLAYAKEIGDGTSSVLTAEKFVIAVCDYIDGTFDAEDTGNIDSLRAIFSVEGIEPKSLRQSLMMRIVENKDPAYVGELFIRKKTYEARAKAEKEKAPEITPELLLVLVLDEPTDTIRQCMGGSAGAPGIKLPTGGGKDPYAALFGRDSGEKSKDEEKKKQPEPETRPANSKDAIYNITEKTKNIRETLKNIVFGQDNAINVFASGYFQAELLSLTDKKRVRPRATFLFAGPPGVGKTFLAESIANALGLPFQRFDMSEYSDNEASVEFCGSDKVYKNGKAGNVTGFVESHPECVLLFDEVEKCHISVIHLFLQMLDAGRLRDNYTDTEVSFKDAIIILTTNAGKQLYEQSESGDFSGLPRKVILNALNRDVNPVTGAPFFPSAICSRFASGNVVMFNHIGAHNLRAIAKKEILRHAANFEREIGIKVNVDENVFTAILFAEGGAADARTIRSRSEMFFDDELYELSRLAASGKTTIGLKDIDKIDIKVCLREGDTQINPLFISKEAPDILVFASEEIAAAVGTYPGLCEISSAKTLDEAAAILHNKDIKVILMDPACGRRSNDTQYLNVEDVESEARDFFRYLRENYRDTPVYILETPGHALDHEEMVSFDRLGVRGELSLESGADALRSRLELICAGIHQQNSMAYLARANKLISFETAQSINEAEKTAEIRLFDFRMVTAVDAEDSKNILSSVSRPNVHFDDVIGAEDAKNELRYFVEYLKNPKKYIGTGVRAPKGIILYGPPGTGKTMLAKAMACESDVTFINAEGNQFLQKLVGEGKDKVHELFRVARKYAPSILFVDEIDAIAKERTGGENALQNGEDILTAFLAEMDGFKNDPSKPVFVLAATNFDVEPGSSRSLDAALMRRFDRKLYIDLPKKDERIRFMRKKLASNKAFEVSDEKMANLAVRSTGMSLADLESVFELALRSMIREGILKVNDDVLDDAFETFNGGEVKKWDAATIERVARHEAGHTYIAWRSGETPSYVTVVSRGDHGGYMQHDSDEDKAIYTKDELLSRIRTSLGGRAAEIVYYGERDGLSTGPSSDLISATSTAQKIICTFGMDADFGLAVVTTRSARDGELSGEVRSAVNRILDEEMKRAIAQITEGKPAIDALVEKLISENHLGGDEIKKIFEENR